MRTLNVPTPDDPQSLPVPLSESLFGPGPKVVTNHGDRPLTTVLRCLCRLLERDGGDGVGSEGPEGERTNDTLHPTIPLPPPTYLTPGVTEEGVTSTVVVKKTSLTYFHPFTTSKNVTVNESNRLGSWDPFGGIITPS